jgi:hypothetical protein
VWFIELFGGVFLAGLLWAQLEYGWRWALPSGAGVALAMLLIRRAVRRRSS